MAKLRRKYSGVRIGADGTKDANKEIAQNWAMLPPARKLEYEQKAREVQRARTLLKSSPLSDPSAGQSSTLDASQKKRLNHLRLDATLQQVSNHPVWGKGLGLHDHIAALRADFVLPLAEQECRTRVASFCAYDSNVLQNRPNAPHFQKACCSLHGGLCKGSAVYAFANRLVWELEQGLAAHKLGAEPILVLCRT